MISQLTDERELEQLLAAGSTLVIYKHSPICLTSTLARRQVESFASEHPDTQVFMIDVIEQRDLSNKAAALLAVPHASPQVILIRAGVQIWNTSHKGIKAEALSRQLDVRQTTRD
ncbi:MAG: bacillithiol system redox-active protein YtxJ [Gemmatimonadota bacterium]|nr:MAG: bacillithiol system redox-active protein YtxJ [Gemmatimonadota bacterium]